MYNYDHQNKCKDAVIVDSWDNDSKEWDITHVDGVNCNKCYVFGKKDDNFYVNECKSRTGMRITNKCKKDNKYEVTDENIKTYLNSDERPCFICEKEKM